jgi:hypothetical protein
MDEQRIREIVREEIRSREVVQLAAVQKHFDDLLAGKSKPHPNEMVLPRAIPGLLAALRKPRTQRSFREWLKQAASRLLDRLAGKGDRS